MGWCSLHYRRWKNTGDATHERSSILSLPAAEPVTYQADLAWLGGFFDGEGCIGVQRHIEDKGVIRFRPIIQLPNTDVPTLAHVEAIMQQHGLGYNTTWRHYRPPNPRAPLWNVVATSYTRCAQWLDVLMPYLRTKAAYAGLLREYCSLGRLSPGPGGHAYSPREREIQALLGIEADDGVRQTRRPVRPELDLAPITIAPSFPPAMDLAWLAGFIDAEDSIGFPFEGRPAVQVRNTHQPTLTVVRAILDHFGQGYNVGQYSQCDGGQPYWNVSVAGYARVSALLALVQPCLRTKSEEAGLMLGYCPSHKPYRPLSARERQILERFGREVRGEPDRHGNAALSADEVRAARWAYDHTEETITALAERYGVSISAMHGIVHRRTYRHITDEASATATAEQPATDPAE